MAVQNSYVKYVVEKHWSFSPLNDGRAQAALLSYLTAPLSLRQIAGEARPPGAASGIAILEAMPSCATPHIDDACAQCVQSQCLYFSLSLECAALADTARHDLGSCVKLAKPTK